MSVSNTGGLAPLPTLFAVKFGAVSGQDATADLNAAAQSIPNSGGVLELQAGATYYLSSSLNLKSNTILEGNGAILVDDVPVSEDFCGFPSIHNSNFNATTVVDHNITVEDLNLDYAYVDGGGSHAINFREASNIDVYLVTFNGGNDATAFEATYDFIVNNCTAYNISNAAYDNWEGASDATVKSNSTAYLTGSGSYLGILFTGVGTSSDDQKCNDVGRHRFQRHNLQRRPSRDMGLCVGRGIGRRQCKSNRQHRLWRKQFGRGDRGLRRR